MTTSNDTPFPSPGSTADVEQGTVLSPRFDKDGLVAAVATDVATGDVLMLAWMNPEALHLSITTGIAHFFSRSRQRIWKKGEESGNLLTIQEMRIDCDQDAIWMKVRVEGASVACHTGARSCFYRVVPIEESGQPRLRTA
jgi:phosphoribosyl-AMP cyclohydrolase